MKPAKVKLTETEIMVINSKLYANLVVTMGFLKSCLLSFGPGWNWLTLEKWLETTYHKCLCSELYFFCLLLVLSRCYVHKRGQGRGNITSQVSRPKNRWFFFQRIEPCKVASAWPKRRSIATGQWPPIIQKHQVPIETWVYWFMYGVSHKSHLKHKWESKDHMKK